LDRKILINQNADVNKEIDRQPKTKSRRGKSKDTLNKSGSAYSGDSSSSENIFDFMDGDATKAIRRNKEKSKPLNRSSSKDES